MIEKSSKKLEYRVISVLDLIPIYNKAVSKAVIRKEFVDIGFFNPLKYIEFLKENKDATKNMDIFVQNIGKLKLNFCSKYSKIYREHTVLTQQLENRFLFPIPLVAKSKWRELPSDKDYLYCEFVELYPLFAIYCCKYRKKNENFFNPNEMQESKEFKGSLSKKFINHYNRSIKKLKLSLLTAFFPKFKEKFKDKIFLLDSPPCVVIFVENASKRELKPLRQATTKGSSGYLDTKKNWEFFRENSTILVFGDKIQKTYRNKMLISIKMLLVQRNHRRMFSVNIANLLLQILRINSDEDNFEKPENFDNLENWTYNHYSTFSIVFNTFLTIYNDKFYYKRDIATLLPKGYLTNFFSLMSRELKIDVSFMSHFKQIIRSVKVVNPFLYKIMLDSVNHGFFSNEKQLLLKNISESDHLEYPEMIELREEHKKIIDHLLKKYIRKFEKFSAIYTDIYEFTSLWPCETRSKLFNEIDLTKYQIYNDKSQKYVEIINSLVTFKILHIKKNPKYANRSVNQKFLLFCLNLNSPVVKIRIPSKLRDILEKL